MDNSVFGGAGGMSDTEGQILEKECGTAIAYDMQKHNQFFTISTRDEMYRFEAANVMYLHAKGNYTDIMTCDRRTITVCSSLSRIHGLLDECVSDSEYSFVRVGKSLVVNMAYVSHINIPGQFFVLSDRKSFSTKLTAPKASLRGLKDLICGENVQEKHV